MEYFPNTDTPSSDITRRLEGDAASPRSPGDSTPAKEEKEETANQTESPFRQDVQPDPILRKVRSQREVVMNLLDQIKAVDTELSVENRSRRDGEKPIQLPYSLEYRRSNDGTRKVPSTDHSFGWRKISKKKFPSTPTRAAAFY